MLCFSCNPAVVGFEDKVMATGCVFSRTNDNGRLCRNTDSQWPTTLLLFVGQKMAGAVRRVFELSITVLKPFPFGKFPKNLLEHSHFPVDGVSAGLWPCADPGASGD
jgi:hypothetical protein